MKIFIREITWLSRDYASFGWGNGYVLIPKGHVLYGKSYYEIEELIPNLNVHGGLTFADYANTLEYKSTDKNYKDCWAVGFDTTHTGDTLNNWPKERVLEETENLKNQLMQFNSY